mmetsp:Transcript_14855/g.27461  ORF Transcript_14855/g.27461 Transcript_14855/m.27461 type:complete len:477 (-) Transcript_14855:126-1556(-)
MAFQGTLLLAILLATDAARDAKATEEKEDIADPTPLTFHRPDVATFAAAAHMKDGLCGHHLSGVTDEALLSALAHQPYAPPRSPAGSSQLQALRQEKIFIVSLQHQSESIMPYWTSELLRLVMALRDAGKPKAHNIFVSVYESGSSDSTVQYLQRVEEHLNFLGISNHIVTGGVVRGHRPRIEYLADIRNKAMEPLMASTESYDRVLWLNDVAFCADGALQILAHALPEAKGGRGADAVCGLDMMRKNRECIFYDTWISHDVDGRNFRNEPPYLSGPGYNSLRAGEPFQVFSCWNGMVAFSADVFQKHGLYFRTGREHLGECAAGEAELIFRDMWKEGRGKFLISPRAVSTYSKQDFRQCALSRQPIVFNHNSPITWKAAPKVVRCCPLRKNKDTVEDKDCFFEHWDRFGTAVPRHWDQIGFTLHDSKQRSPTPFLHASKSSGSTRAKGSDRNSMQSNSRSNFRSRHVGARRWRVP